MRRLAFLTFYILCILGGFGWALYRTFTNIDMTNARLLVTFWPEWIAIIVGITALNAIRTYWFSKRL
jgi:hypothetical protein